MLRAVSWDILYSPFHMKKERIHDDWQDDTVRDDMSIDKVEMTCVSSASFDYQH